jgi:hypothetical protein
MHKYFQATQFQEWDLTCIYNRDALLETGQAADISEIPIS